MIYLQPRKKPFSLSFRTFGLLAMLVVALLFVFYFAATPLQALFHTLLRPVWALEQSMFGQSGVFAALITDKQTLLEENVNLRLQLAESRLETKLTDVLYKENAELKEILGRSSNASRIIAVVLARPPRLFYDTLLVDLGRKDGLVQGARAYVLGNVAIGEVSTLHEHTALVTLYSTADTKTPVLLDDIAAEAYGRGGGNYMIELPRDVTVATGTVVMLPGIIPTVFGLVESVEAHPADPIQRIYFRNPLSLQQVHFVSLEVSREGTEPTVQEFPLP